MAPGFWKKLKQFGQKVWGGIKKGAKWINKNVVQKVLPFAKPFLPAGVGKAVEAVSDGIDGNWGKAKQQVQDWGTTRLKPVLKG